MITLNEPIRNSTGVFTPIAKDVGKKETFYLCNYKSDVNSCYDGQFPIRDKELEFLKNMSKKK